MASVGTLRDHLVQELQDLLNAEQQLVDALPKMAERASRRELKAAFKNHLAETKRHAQRATEALGLLGADASGKTCEAMEGLLEEGEELMSDGEPGALLDAMMITAAQKVEHYEIASYGTVRTYAQVLGEKGVARLLAQTLKEEKTADRKLTQIAEGQVNSRAAEEWHEQAEAAGLLDRGAKWIGSTMGSVARRVMPSAGATASDHGSSNRGRKAARRSRSTSRSKRAR